MMARPGAPALAYVAAGFIRGSDAPQESSETNGIMCSG